MTSEQIFQAQIDSMCQAFEASRNLGFGSNIFHRGLWVADKMPTVATVGDGVTEVGCHYAHGQLDVIVCADDSVPVTEEQLAGAVQGIASAAVPLGNVWDRVRFATNDEEFTRFYRDRSPEGSYNFWFIRRVALEVERAGGIDDDVVTVTHRFDFDYFRGMEASE